MKHPSSNWIQTALAVFLVALTPIRQSVAQANPHYVPDSVIVSVRDPSEASTLNAERILEVVSDPRLDIELFHHLGEPLSAKKIFYGSIPQVQRNAAYEALSLVAKSYVTLRYGAETDTNEIV